MQDQPRNVLHQFLGQRVNLDAPEQMEFLVPLESKEKSVLQEDQDKMGAPAPKVIQDLSEREA